MKLLVFNHKKVSLRGHIQTIRTRISSRIIATAFLLFFSADMLHTTGVNNSAQADFLLQPSQTQRFAHTVSFRVSRGSQIAIISCEL